MSLSSYTKTLVQDLKDKVTAAQHNNQENQLGALTDHALKLELLPAQNVAFGTVAAGTAAEKPVFVAPAAGVLVNLMLVNAANLAANPANNTRLDLINKGSAGDGATILATFNGASDAFTAFDAFVKSLNVTVAQGDVLSLRKTDTGAGAAVTELLVSVGIKPTA